MTRRIVTTSVEYVGGPLDGTIDILHVPLPQQITRYLWSGFTTEGRTRYEWQHEHTGRRAPCTYHPHGGARGCPNRPKADA